MNVGEALMRDGITRIIHRHLNQDPPCLGASVRDEFVEKPVRRFVDLGR
jgi:hypothetical protein